MLFYCVKKQMFNYSLCSIFLDFKRKWIFTECILWDTFNNVDTYFCLGSQGGVESSMILQCPEHTENISNVSSWLMNEKHEEIKEKAFKMKLQYLKTKTTSGEFLFVYNCEVLV